MPKLLGSLTRAASRRPGEPLNVISWPTHEAYQTNLARTGHSFFLVQGKGIKTWNSAFRPLPAGHVLLDIARGNEQLPPDIDFDCILSQNKAGQYPMAVRLSAQLHLPLITLEHCLPFPAWGERKLAQLQKMRGDIDVFISEYSRKEWGWGEDEASVVHHGVDSEVFRPKEELGRKKIFLSVVNDWKNRDYACGFHLWEEAMRNLPVKVLGDNPGLSHPASCLGELVHAYQHARVFVNTSLVSPVPSVLLEAMACGCAVVSTNTCMIPEIIEHGKNGLLGKDAREIRKLALLLMEDEKLAHELGENARQTILKRFSLEKFVENWQGIFDRAVEVVYRGQRS